MSSVGSKSELWSGCLTFPTGGRGNWIGGTLSKAPENSKLTLSGFEESILIFPLTLNRRSSSNSIKLLMVDDSKSINWLILVQSFPNKPFFLKNRVSCNEIQIKVSNFSYLSQLMEKLSVLKLPSQLSRAIPISRRLKRCRVSRQKDLSGDPV